MSRPTGEYEQATLSSIIGIVCITAGAEGIVEVSLPGCPSRYQKSARGDSGEKGIKELLERATDQLDGYLRGVTRSFNVPLALSGTPFQLAVWRLIRAIPYGATCSYGEIALELGGVGKARAVGNAAGANPVPLLVPCHRVVGVQGRVGGFSADLSLKRYLLGMEKDNCVFTSTG